MTKDIDKESSYYKHEKIYQKKTDKIGTER